MTVFSFSSWEEFEQHMKIASEDADAALHPIQRSITWGDHAVSFAPEQHLIIWGRIWTVEESARSERQAGGDDDEVAFMLATLKAKHEDNLMWSRWYSLAEPDGEFGSIHRLNLWPVSQRLYQAAEALRWQGNALPMELVSELERAYDAYRRHRLGIGR